MAYSTTSYFSNAIVGIPNVGADVDITELHGSPKFALGTKFERQDGCIFRYAHFGATVNQARLVAPVLDGNAGVLSTAVAVLATSSSYQQGVERAGIYPGMVGSRFIVLNASAHTAGADAFDGGYISVTSGTGAGQFFRIKRSAAAVGTTNLLELYDKIQTGLDANSAIGIVCSKYSNLQQQSGNISLVTDLALAVGVSVTTGASNTWGWIQTKGPCQIAAFGTQSTANAIGQWVCAATSGDGKVGIWGEVAVASTTTGSTLASALGRLPAIGRVMSWASANSSNAIVDLALD